MLNGLTRLIDGFRFRTSVTIFVSLSVIRGFGRSFAIRNFGILVLRGNCRYEVLIIRAIYRFYTFDIRPNGRHKGVEDLPFVIDLRVPMFLLNSFAIFPILVGELLMTYCLYRFPLFYDCRVIRSMELTFFS